MVNPTYNSKKSSDRIYFKTLELEINRKRSRNTSAALVSAERPASLSANGPFGWSLIRMDRIDLSWQIIGYLSFYIALS